MQKQKTILIVDDETEVCDLLSIYLEAEGYKLLIAHDGRTALDFFTHEKIDLIILDIMLPYIDGINLCKEIRTKSMLPIIMLSAKKQTTDKILSLNLGADDYMEKPFNPLELVARIKALFRRHSHETKQTAAQSELYHLDTLEIDVAGHTVRKNGHDIALTPKEFAILTLLLKHRGQVFSIEQIYETIWNDPFFQPSSYNTVMVHIKKLREKIEDTVKKPVYIKTVWGVGYKIDK